MAYKRNVALGSRPQTDRLPDWAGMGATIVEWLQQRGLWAVLAEKLKIQREGGYVGLDVVLFLLFYFGAGQKTGLKEFSELARPYRAQLAVVGGRRQFPTQSAISRVLAAAEPEQVSSFGSWLLLEAPGVIDVLQHPSVLTRDALGNGWHVMDWDPTVTTLRHRALPVLEGTPNARRRSATLAAPGYSGRKRGDVQLSRAMLQHAGAGLWLGIEIGPGNGKGRSAFHSAIEHTIATCEYADLPRDKVILRADGVAGNVPFITACMDRGVHFITRLARYELLKDPDIIEHLNGAEWFEVPSSYSGPTRESADLGRVLLKPDRTSVKEDESAFAPIEVRVVVSRFRCDGAGHGAGTVLDDWQYELYCTDLEPAAWPGAQIVCGYYGRTGQENRFSQEDREFGLDRVFSYQLPGQELATVIGLFVWNFLICRGMDLAQPPRELPPQPLAESKAIVEPAQLPRQERPEDEVKQDASLVEATPTIVELGSPATERLAELPAAAPSESTPGAPVANPLDEIDWARILQRHRGWDWMQDRVGVRCPAGALLPLGRIEERAGRPVRASFIAGPGTCDACELRPSCIRSKYPQYRKTLLLPVESPEDGDRLVMWRGGEVRREQLKPKKTAKKTGALKSLSWRPPGLPSEPPVFTVTAPTLLPAELRKISYRSTRTGEVHVSVDLPEVRPRPSAVLALSPARRQNRRLSWDERLRWNELPDGATVHVNFLSNGMGNLLHPAADDAEMPAKSA